jgi:hypothetical protein
MVAINVNGERSDLLGPPAAGGRQALNDPDTLQLAGGTGLNSVAIWTWLLI